MKINKTISLDLDVMKELEKEKNSSALINSYLRDYYKLGEIKEDQETIKKKEEQIQKEMKEAFGDLG